MSTDTTNRRRFLRDASRAALVFATGGVAGVLLNRRQLRADVWQIDPFRCVQCGQCATHCVMDVSAVKCAHDFTMCGYCELCTAFFVPEPNELNSGAENQLCPVGAIRRRFVEDPYYEYDIDTDVCYGCGKCVKGCTQFGNGSLYLQIDQDRCLHCNECSIAAACPADAFFHRSAGRPYVTKHAGAENL